MKFQKIRQYISAPRINRYMTATGNSVVRTNKLYKANLKVIQSFHPLIGILEVILRNRINDILSGHFTDPDWIINQKTGFMSHSSLRYTHKKTGRIVINDFLKKQVENAEKRLRKARIIPTSGKIISEQTFGFWTDLFEVHHYRILIGKPIQIFKNLPPGYGRKEACDELNNIRVFRNRINHNEPICFSGNNIDFTYARKVYDSIINVFSWIDPEILTYIKDIDKVQINIAKAERI